MKTLLIILAIIVILLVIAAIGLKFRKKDIVEEELIKREFKRRYDQLISLGLIECSFYDFMVGVNEGKKLI